VDSVIHTLRIFLEMIVLTMRALVAMLEDKMNTPVLLLGVSVMEHIMMAMVKYM
jgi:hypothetical protein